MVKVLTNPLSAKDYEHWQWETGIFSYKILSGAGFVDFPVY